MAPSPCGTRRAVELWRHLASGPRKRPPSKFAPELSVLVRPDVVLGRHEFGHWEADLVHFRQKFGPTNVTRRRSVAFDRGSEFIDWPSMRFTGLEICLLGLACPRQRVMNTLALIGGVFFVDMPHFLPPTPRHAPTHLPPTGQRPSGSSWLRY